MNLNKGIVAETVKIEGDVTINIDCEQNDSQLDTVNGRTHLKGIAVELKRTLQTQYCDIELPRAAWMEDLDLNMSELYVDLVMYIKTKRSGADHFFKEIDLKDIFLKVDDDVAPCRILIDGAAGFGKTTLTFKIAYDWAHGEDYLRQFAFVIVIQLRQWENQSIEDILAEAASVNNYAKKDVLNFLSLKQNKVLLLLDGYDELSSAGKDAVMPLLTNQRYAGMTVIVTCRNGASLRAAKARPNKLCPELVKKLIWNKCMQIRGVRKENQRHFLELYLSPKKLAAVTDKIDQVTSSETEGLFDCPLFLLLWATLLEEDEINIPQNETELYKALFNCMIGRSLIRERILTVGEEFDLFDEQNTEYEFIRRLLVDFGAIALCSLAENTLLLTGKDILSCCKNDARILKFGFLSSNITKQSRRKRSFFEPIHKTILEFIAAYSLFWHFSNSNAEHFNCSAIVYSEVIFDFSLVLPFLVGLLGKQVSHVLQRLSCIGFVISHCFARLQDILFQYGVEDERTIQSLAQYSPAVTNRDVSGKKDFLKSTFHCQLLRYGVQAERIKVIRVFSSEMTLPRDVVIPCLRLGDTVLQGESESPERFVTFMFSCDAVLRWFNVTNYQETFLPVICKSLGDETMSSKRFLDRLRCECNKPARFPLLIQILETNKLIALDLTIALTQNEMDILFIAVGACNSLDEFHLWNNDSKTKLSVDLDHFASNQGLPKVWKRLGFEGLLDIKEPSSSQHLSVEEFRLESCSSRISASMFEEVKVLDIDIDSTSIVKFLKLPDQWSGFSTLIELCVGVGSLHDEEILRALSHMVNLEILQLTLNYFETVCEFICKVCTTVSSCKLKVLDIDSNEYDLSVTSKTIGNVIDLLARGERENLLQKRDACTDVKICCMPYLQTLGLNFSYVNGDDCELVKMVQLLLSCVEKGTLLKLYLSAPNLWTNNAFRNLIKECLLHKTITIDKERRGSHHDDTRLKKWEFDRDWYSPPEAFVFSLTTNAFKNFSNSSGDT